MSTTPQKLIIKDSLKGKRADVAISELIEISRSAFKTRILEKHLLINGKEKSYSTIVNENDVVEFTLKELEPLSIEPEDIPISIIYEDNDFVIINKSAGLVVHAGGGTKKNTLVNALLFHFKEWNKFGDSIRPGIVHRLDKDTSGIIIVAKHPNSFQALQKQFAERSVHKEYRAIVFPALKTKSIFIDTPIGRNPNDRKKMNVFGLNAKAARTKIEEIQNFKSFSYIAAFPETGRTHQIRVHLNSIGHSIIGDSVYSGIKMFPKNGKKILRQMLHAYKINFIHPITKKPVSFTAELPKDFEECLSFIMKT